MNCPNCNSLVTPTQKFCGRCGSDLRSLNSPGEKNLARFSMVGLYLQDLLSAIHNMDDMFGRGAKWRFYEYFTKNVFAAHLLLDTDIPKEASDALLILHKISGQAVSSPEHLRTFNDTMIDYYKGKGYVEDGTVKGI